MKDAQKAWDEMRTANAAGESKILGNYPMTYRRLISPVSAVQFERLLGIDEALKSMQAKSWTPVQQHEETEEETEVKRNEEEPSAADLYKEYAKNASSQGRAVDVGHLEDECKQEQPAAVVGACTFITCSHGCGMQMTLQEASFHNQHICREREVQCLSCGHSCIAHELMHHMTEKCEHRYILCSRGPRVTRVNAKDGSDHVLMHENETAGTDSSTQNGLHHKSESDPRAANHSSLSTPGKHILALSQYTPQQLQKYFKNLFKIGDKNGDGLLERDELVALLSHSGFPFDLGTVDEILRDGDINGDGMLDCAEFTTLMTRHATEHE